MPQRPTIAIVGAGPGGLTAANILARSGWSFDVFEADPSAASRDQGGTLDLHPEDGQLALMRAGLLGEFLALARHDDQEQRVRDFATGNILREDIPKPGEGNRPEIDRSVLRELMLSRLKPGLIHWGAPIDEVVALADGRHELRAACGTYGPYDLVIGADGAWSKCRTALTSIRPNYTGITFVELWLSDVDRAHPAHSLLVGRGSMFSFHGGIGIVAQRNGNANVRVYVAFRSEPEHSVRPDVALANMTKDQLLAKFAGWAPSMRALISDCDVIAAVRPISALPAPLAWPHRDGVTLLGDAAHVMPPLGLGVNLAMLDASDLAGALVCGGNDWRSAVTRYESQMLDRAAPLAAQTAVAFEAWFGEGAAPPLLGGQ